MRGCFLRGIHTSEKDFKNHEEVKDFVILFGENTVTVKHVDERLSFRGLQLLFGGANKKSCCPESIVNRRGRINCAVVQVVPEMPNGLALSAHRVHHCNVA